MIRNAVLGVLAFGVTAAAAGWVWTAFEFPFAIMLPAVVGWFVVVRARYDGRKALTAALVGGIAFTAVFIGGLFLAITDGSPVPMAGWLAAVLSASGAGAITGWVIGRTQGAGIMAAFTAVGMLAAVLAAAVLQSAAPGSVQVAGSAQSAYVALQMGVIGALVGAAAGAGVAYVADRAAGATPDHTGMREAHGV